MVSEAILVKPEFSLAAVAAAIDDPAVLDPNIRLVLLAISVACLPSASLQATVPTFYLHLG